jgi:hypothetical protein
MKLWVRIYENVVRRLQSSILDLRHPDIFNNNEFRVTLKISYPNLKLTLLIDAGWLEIWKMVFAKLILFPPKKNFFAQKDFLFPKYQKKFWREKNQLSKKGRSIFVLCFPLVSPSPLIFSGFRPFFLIRNHCKALLYTKWNACPSEFFSNHFISLWYKMIYNYLKSRFPNHFFK